MKGATKKGAEVAAAAERADDVPTEREFREALVILSGWRAEWWNLEAVRFEVGAGQTLLVIPYKEPRDGITGARYPLVRNTNPPGAWQGGFGQASAKEYGMPSAAKLRAIAKECFAHLRQYFPQYFDDASGSDYNTADNPPSEAAVTPPLRMREDLNIAIKQARTEALARLVDLDNPKLSADERLTRARRLVRSFERRRAENPDFPTSPEVLKAFSIMNKDKYRRFIKPKRAAARRAKLAM